MANKGAFKPGDPRAGRRTGSQNKATAQAREVFQQFVDANAARAQELWQQVADKDPARAIELLAKLAEFVMPKLSRSTIDGELGVRGRLVITD